MKKKILFFVAGVLLIGLTGIIKAEGPGCAQCYSSPPWGGGSDYTVDVRGDCYSDWMFCGTVVRCVTGNAQCDPWECHTEFEGCTVTFE